MKEDLKQKILNLDSRIKYCHIEYDYDGYYGEISFNYKWDNSDVIKEFGRQKFDSDTQEDFVKQVTNFLNKKHETFIIV